MKADRTKDRLPEPLADSELVRRFVSELSGDYWKAQVPAVCEAFGVGILEANRCIRRHRFGA